MGGGHGKLSKMPREELLKIPLKKLLEERERVEQLARDFRGSAKRLEAPMRGGKKYVARNKAASEEKQAEEDYMNSMAEDYEHFGRTLADVIEQKQGAVPAVPAHHTSTGPIKF